jgi:hypothetical protein
VSEIVIDRYSVSVPTDYAETEEELAEVAIDEARERTKLYCIPAEWKAFVVARGYETTFLVTRRRRRTKK